MTDAGPTVPARRLGKALKRLREAARKSQVQAGEWVSTPSTTISKYENADRIPSESHLKLMLNCYGVDWEQGVLGAELLQLGRQAREPGWWADYSDVVPEWFTDRLGLETAAEKLCIYDTGAVPGLLQTPEYARAVITTVNSAGPPENADRIAAVRAARQRRLNDDDLILHTILDEAVLTRRIGSPDVMREQIVALREAAQRSNITLQILPFERGAHPGIGGPFTTIRFPGDDEMDTVYIELRGGAVYLDRTLDVQRYVATFEELARLALSTEETTEFLEKIERRYD